MTKTVDDQYASKAEERRRRTEEMKDSTNEELSSSAAIQQSGVVKGDFKDARKTNHSASLHGTAVAVQKEDTRNVEKGAVGNARRVEIQGGEVPTALTDMESKVSARRGHVARMISGASAEPSARQSKEAAKDSLIKAEISALRGVPKLDSDPVRSLDARINEKVSERRLGNTAVQGSDGANSDPPQVQQQGGELSHKNIQAEIIDPIEERQKIIDEVQSEFISNAVVASVKEVKEGDDGKSVSIKAITCFVIGTLVLFGAILGGVCGGAGLCTRTRMVVDPVKRAKDITTLINGVTLRILPITMPSDSLEGVGASTISPEEEALRFVIRDDVLQLLPGEDDDRLIQRYALAVLWFSNGPWSDILAEAFSHNVVKDPVRSWFVGTNECLWTGVTCVDGMVTEIDLEAKSMKGALPADLVLLKGLTTLALSANDLTGEIPSFLTKLTGLKHLDLSYNFVEGPAFPAFLPNFPSLKEYDIRLNDLNGTIPEFLTSMTQIEKLRFAHNYLTGTVPNGMADLSQLRVLEFGWNELNGTIPSGLFDLTNLQQLDISGVSDFSAVSVSSLSRLSQLTHLSINFLELVEETLPSEVGDWWPKLKILQMRNCGFKGTIPETIARWTNLETININFNDFTGTIPSGIFDAWPNMQSFGFRLNNFQGTLSNGIGHWSNLTRFDARDNMLTGTLPTEVGLLTNLVSFFLTNNQFSGTIPVEVLSFNDAEIWLDLNNFTGVAPFCVDGNEVAHLVDCDLVECECCSSCVPAN